MIAFLLPARNRIIGALPDCPNPRHVEALMRAKHGELNWWSQRAFARAAQAAAARAAADPVNAERVAQSVIDRPPAGERRQSAPVTCLIVVLTIAGVAVFGAIRSGQIDPIGYTQSFVSEHMPSWLQ